MERRSHGAKMTEGSRRGEQSKSLAGHIVWSDASTHLYIGILICKACSDGGESRAVGGSAARRKRSGAVGNFETDRDIRLRRAEVERFNRERNCERRTLPNPARRRQRNQVERRRGSQHRRLLRLRRR